MQHTDAQREAIETVGEHICVRAGAGSGKTNTLAHRVAHLIVNGADPRRILLMTFSRRAAAEMTRRVELIAREVMGSSAGIMTDALSWAGTFHGIGARLLREYAYQVGLDPARIQSRARRHGLAVLPNLALVDERKREVGEGSQIPAGANASLGRDHWQQVLVEESQQVVGKLGGHSGCPHGERMGACEQ